jgi:hypothetical protein
MVAIEVEVEQQWVNKITGQRERHGLTESRVTGSPRLHV